MESYQNPYPPGAGRPAPPGADQYYRGAPQLDPSYPPQGGYGYAPPPQQYGYQVTSGHTQKFVKKWLSCDIAGRPSSWSSIRAAAAAVPAAGAGATSGSDRGPGGRAV